MVKYCAVSGDTQKVGLNVLPFFHIYGFNAILNSTFQQGLHMVCLSKFTPEDYISCVVKFKVIVSLLNLLILICYKRVINRTEFSEFIEFIDSDLLQKSDK